MSTPLDSFAAGRVIAERYRLERRIAVGGMGEVWEALDERLGRNVALKVLRAELSDDDEFLHRFRIEARTVASLNHSGVASIHDYGEDDAADDGRRLAYLVMELVRGEPLSAVIARGPLETAETLRIMEQASYALHAAHERGFVHRDVKPGNILIRVDGTVKLTDFGIAKAANAVPVTRTGMVMGTAHYIAPEQASGGEAGPEGDVYSLGIVGYECLAGHRPFRADNAVAVAMMQVRDAPPPLPGTVDARVRRLIETILVKDPDRRYADGAELAAAVAAIRRDEPLPTPRRMAAQGLSLGPDPGGATARATPAAASPEATPAEAPTTHRRRSKKERRAARNKASTARAGSTDVESGPSPAAGPPADRSTPSSTPSSLAAGGPGAASAATGSPAGTRPPANTERPGGTPARTSGGTGGSTSGSGTARPGAGRAGGPGTGSGPIRPRTPGGGSGAVRQSGPGPSSDPIRPGSPGTGSGPIRPGASGQAPARAPGTGSRPPGTPDGGSDPSRPGASGTTGASRPGTPAAGTTGATRPGTGSTGAGQAGSRGGAAPVPQPFAGMPGSGAPSSRSGSDPRSASRGGSTTASAAGPRAVPPRPPLRPEAPPAPPTEPLRITAPRHSGRTGTVLLVAFVVLIVAAVIVAALTVPKLFAAGPEPGTGPGPAMTRSFAAPGSVTGRGVVRTRPAVDEGPTGPNDVTAVPIGPKEVR
ncbi:hypothetical protein GCM10009836_62690 [Pseudonocardia ailaonensis]|uniref:non-specific serine/threonine protein kinase n=1 Tax=Pseudonocardia ailaonensis TaxID=367279 RepID=A0ABN2NKC6_9PSEU